MRFIEGFNKIEAPMFELLTKDVYFVWTDQRMAVFDNLKEKTTTTHVL